MTNIMITGRCNLKCPYCFANEFVNKENENITLEDFKKAIDHIHFPRARAVLHSHTLVII